MLCQAGASNTMSLAYARYVMWFVYFRYVFTYVFTTVEVITTSATSHVRVICSNYFDSSAVR